MERLSLWDESAFDGLEVSRTPEETLADQALDEVEAWFHERGDALAPLLGKTIRRALDEVIDGGRTGRWAVSQLETTEKTYIGTKVELLVRAALELPRQRPLDTEIAGYPVDFKWSSKRWGWQIPTEAVGQICFLLHGDEDRRVFHAGLLRCREEWLNKGANKDKKRTVSKVGRTHIRWLAEGPLPPNFLSTLPPSVRDSIMAEPAGQPRVTKLFTLVQKTPVPRLAIVTLAQQEGDPMRRIRRDKGDRLGGLRVLGGHYTRTNAIVQMLGYPPLAKDEYMAVPSAELSALGFE